MKRFILRTLFFSSSIYFTIVLLILFFVYRSERDVAEYRTDKGVTTIFLGDSHVQQSVNDKLLIDSQSFARDSESYYFTFYKLQKLVHNSKNIKTVYLGFGYHNLSSYFDDYVFGKYSEDIATRYMAFLPFKEKIKFVLINFLTLPRFLRQVLKNNSEKTYHGGYSNPYNQTRVDKINMEKGLSYQFFTNEKVNGISTRNIKSLKKIIAFCKEKKIRLYFLKTPLHPYYEQRVPSFFISQYSQIVKESNVKVVDFNKLKLYSNSFMPDGSHLSSQGAKQTSLVLKNLMTN